MRSSTLGFERMLELVEERSAVLRSAIAGALDVRVPGCPEWTGRDLVAHLGEVHRSWAAVVAAGPAEGPPEEVPEDRPTGDLLDWSERSTDALLSALHAAGPDRRVWTWWGEPATSGAVARHQVQEASVHAWDAEDTVGRAGPLPVDAAADGVEEFLSTGLPFAGPWPHPPGSVAFVADDAPSLRLRVVLAPEGARLERRDGDADAVVRGSASDLVLALYRRHGPEGLAMSGDVELIRRLLVWFRTD